MHEDLVLSGARPFALFEGDAGFLHESIEARAEWSSALWTCDWILGRGNVLTQTIETCDMGMYAHNHRSLCCCQAKTTFVKVLGHRVLGSIYKILS